MNGDDIIILAKRNLQLIDVKQLFGYFVRATCGINILFN